MYMYAFHIHHAHLYFPYAFLPRNHEHFMNWKDRKDILKKEQLLELDSKHYRQ